MKCQSAGETALHFCLHNKKAESFLEEQTLLHLNFEITACTPPVMSREGPGRERKQNKQPRNTTDGKKQSPGPNIKGFLDSW